MKHLCATASLGSATAPDPGSDDHVRGHGPTAIVYFDLACPRCAGVWAEIAALPLRLCVRHFPVASKRPRSPALHAATEAAGLHSEDAFWALWEGLLSDRAHVDDPHLWERARELGIDVDCFERDRRSKPVSERVRRDFRTGIRAGMTATPAGFTADGALDSDLAAALSELAERGGDAGAPARR